MADRLRPMPSRCALIVAAVLIIVLVPQIGWTQPPSVDTLLARLFEGTSRDPYDLTADFTGSLTVTIKRGTLVVTADGLFREWRGLDGIKHRKVTVHNLNLPFILRPFAPSIRTVIADKIETQAESPENFTNHDIFVLEEVPTGGYVLAGVHRDIVNDAIDRYGHPEDKTDVTTRRKIAQWLYTAPTMKEFIVRPGPPYALRATMDEHDLLTELAVSYDWGEVSTRIGYVWIEGQPVWGDLQADTVSHLSGVGVVTGQLVLKITNQCLNCRQHP